MIHRCLLFLLASVLCARGEDAVALLRKLDDGFSAVFEKVAPSVVVIEATKAEAAEPTTPFDFFRREELPPNGKRERDWTLPQVPVQSEGSGFVIRADGLIVTNRHVVIDSEKIEVRGYGGQRWEATLIADDERTDVAVLKIEAANLTVVQWGDSDALRVGQFVCAIGAPYNQDFSFTCGWVSGKGRSNLLSPASSKVLFEDYIQTDAFINPGNSGGPLFDVEGRVVGMNTLVNGIGRGLAFAIPANLLRDVTDQLITTGRVRRPWLGLRFTSLESSRALREQFPGIADGVLINTVEAGTPAAKSDLRASDLVVAVDSVPLRRSHDLVRYVQRQKVGQTLRFTVFRKGETLEIPLVTGEQPDAPSPSIDRSPAPNLGLKLTVAESGDGVVVSDVEPGSAAARADLRAGDLITEVGSESFSVPAATLKAIHKSLSDNPKKGALVQFFRGGKKSWVIIERNPR